MPAPDKPTLFQFEDIETFLVGQLASVTGIPEAHVLEFLGNNDERHSPRIEIEFEDGPSNAGPKPTTSQDIYDNADFSLRVRYIRQYDRTTTTQAASKAEAKKHLGQIRELFNRETKIFNDASLEHHGVHLIVPQGTSKSLDPENDELIVEMTWSGQFQIVPASWP